MRQGTFFRFTALLLTVFIQGCGGGTAAPPVSNGLLLVNVPLVQSTAPSNLKDGVGFNASLSVTFDEKMDPGTVNTSTFMLSASGGSPVAGTVTYSGRTAVFKPAAPLAPNTIYSATVTTGVRCAGSGNQLPTDYNWMFVTSDVPDTTAPQITQTAFAVAETGGIYGGLVVAFFTEAMDPATLTPATFLIKDPNGAPVAGMVAYIGLNAVFYPALPFEANASYSATVTTGAEDLAGNGLAKDRSWTFMTPNASTLLGKASTVSSTTPTDDATDVLLGSEITARFSQTMDPDTITTATFTLWAPGRVRVPGTVSYDGVNAVFIPAAPLLPNTSYEALISATAKSLAGVPLGMDYEWLFATGTDLLGTPPQAMFTVPMENATDIGVNTSVLVTFDEPMDPLSLTTATFTLTAPDASQVEDLVSYVGTTAVFTPSSQLFPGIIYTARITTSATDDGGEPLAHDLVWTFETTDMTSSGVFEVIFSDPAPNDTNTPLNKKFNIAFNQVMDPRTITTANIIVTAPDGTVVPGTVGYLGYIAFFTPSARLDQLTTYTITVTTDVKSIEGTPLPAPYICSFTTVMLL